MQAVVRMVAQLELAIPRRRGRPRKPAERKVGWKHKRRVRIAKRMAVHVTMRLHGDVRNARKFGVYRAIARATFTAMTTRRMRIVHFSVQRTHLHAIVEVDGMMDLARGMQGFQIAAAKRINRVLGRSGCVFADRYHAHYLKAPTEARNAIRY